MNSEYFCASPFTRMTRSPDGNLRTCVYHPPLLKKYHTLSDAFYSNEMDVIRQEMIDGKRRPECEWCYFYDKTDQYSCRSDINERYLRRENKKNISEIPITELVEIDFAASNKCNFICVTCDESASSGWEKRNQEFRFHEFTSQKKSDINLEDLKNLHQITLMGGEPTIDPFFSDDFWKMLEEKVSEDAHFQMVTNCSFFPKKQWIEFLEKINHVCIGISLDGVGNVGEFCRLGWKERVWRKNFLKWIDFFESKKYERESRHEGLWINIVVHNYNILDIKNTLEYVDVNYGMRDRVMMTVAFGPEFICPSYLPEKYKRKILNSEFYDDNHKEFIIDILYKKDYSEKIYNKFLDYTKYLQTFTNIPKECLHFV